MKILSLRNHERLVVAFGLLMMLPLFVFLRLWEPHRAPYRVDYNISPSAAILDLQPLKLAVVGLAVIGFFVIIYAELRWQAVANWIHRLLSSEWRIISLLLLIFILLNSQLVLPGYSTAVDGVGSVHLVWLWQKYLKVGKLPLWTTVSWMGYPLLYAGSFLFPVLTALVGFITDIYTATKILLVFFHALSGITMYLFVKRVSKSSLAGVAAGLAYTLSSFHYHYEVQTGRHSMSLVFVLIPLALWRLECLLARWDARRAGLLALPLALLMWTHLTFGFFAFLFTLSYAILRLLLDLMLKKQSLSAAQLLMLVGGLGGGLLASVVFILPPMIDRDLFYTAGDNLKGFFTLGAINLNDILRVSGSSNLNAGYIGASLFVFALVGIYLSIRHRHAAGLAITVLLMISLYLSIGAAYLPFDDIFAAIPFGWIIYVVKSSGHYLTYVMVTTSALVGLAASRPLIQKVTVVLLIIVGVLGMIGIAPVLHQFRLIFTTCGLITTPIVLVCLVFVAVLLVARYKQTLDESAWFLVIVCILLGELLPLTFVKFYYAFSKTYLEGRDPAYRFVIQQESIPGRVLDLGIGNANYDSVIATGLPCLKCGGHELAPRRSAELAAATSALVKENITSTGTVGRVAHNLLYITNTAFVISDSPVAGAQTGGDGEAYLLAVPHSPLMVTDHVDLAPADSTWTDLAAMIDLDQERLYSTALYVDEPSLLPIDDSDELLLRAQVLAYDSSISPTDISFWLSEPGFAQISFAYFPYLCVYLDGVQIEPIETSFGLIGLWVDEGQHHVAIRFCPSSLQGATAIISAAAVLGSIALVVFNPWALPGRSTADAQIEPDLGFTRDD